MHIDPFHDVDIMTRCLHSNHLNGTIPSSLGNLTNLAWLYVCCSCTWCWCSRDLHSNQLTGSIPPSLGNLTNLQFLYDFGYFHDIDAMTDIWTPINWMVLFQYHWEISANYYGCMPLDYVHNIDIMYRHMDSNHLNGTIPVSLGNLTDLEYLYVFDWFIMLIFW